MPRFQASLYRVTFDQESEAKIVLVVPADAADKVVKLTGLSGQLLDVEIEPSEKG